MIACMVIINKEHLFLIYYELKQDKDDPVTVEVAKRVYVSSKLLCVCV